MSEERMEELIEYEFLLYDTVFFQFLWFFLARRGKGWEVKDNTHEIRRTKMFYLHLITSVFVLIKN